MHEQDAGAHDDRGAAVIVVGGGAAGIMAAWRAASCGARALLLERNLRLGTKILISGGGKCNVTHDGSAGELLQAFRQAEARFLRPSSHRFTGRDVVALLAERGVACAVRPDGRVFPAEGAARDVVAAFEAVLAGAGVEVRYGALVTGIRVVDGRACGVETASGPVAARAVVVATGGSSYPATGSTGDGWRWARELGHTVTPLRAALAPIVLDPGPPDAWSGIALRSCVLAARQGGRRVAKRPGDILFTHRGVSGPAVLAISREVAERMVDGPIELEADLRPDYRDADLVERIAEAAAAAPKRQVATVAHPFAPHRLIPALLASAGIDGAAQCAHLSREARVRLAETIKAWPLGRVRGVPMERGEVVAGGVALDEVEPATMASRRVPGLYLCGEMLDVAGPVGGYNLQAAFSTGFAAGEAAAAASAE